MVNFSKEYSSGEEVVESAEQVTPAVHESIQTIQHTMRLGEYDIVAATPWVRNANMELIRRLPDMSAPQIIDAACGTGDPTSLLLNRYPDASITAIDHSPAMLEEAHVKLGGDARVRMYQGDMTQLHHNAENVDIISSFNAVHYLKGSAKKEFFDSAARTLRPGGTFAVNTGFFKGAKTSGTELSYQAFGMDLFAALTKRIPSPTRDLKQQMTRKGDLSMDEYVALMQESGFTVTSCDAIEQQMTIKSIRDFFATDEVAEAFFPTMDRTMAREILMEAIAANTSQYSDENSIFPRSWLYLTGVKN